MKKLAIFALILVVLAGTGFAVVQRNTALGQTAAVVEAAESESSANLAAQRIIVDARVVPMQHANLSLAASGIMSEVLVEEGDKVEAGQVLVRLESARQQAAVVQAEAQLSRSLAQLAELEAAAPESRNWNRPGLR